MKKTKMILALFMAMLVVLGGMFMAAADEGQGSMDVSPGDDNEPPVVEPTEPPVTSDPTDEPTSEPTYEPTADPTDEPTSEPTDEPTTEPTDEPTAEPSYEPDPEPPVVNNSGGSDTSQGSVTRPSVNTGGSIRQPTSSSRAPLGGTVSGGGSGSSGGTQTVDDDGPQYVTFARVTQKSNSMSRTLFYSGAACVGTGALGLIVLVVFIIRGRHVDDREEIFAEIEQAAVRQPVRPRQPQPPQQLRQEEYEDDPYAQYDRQYDGYDGEEYEDRSYQQPYDPGYVQGNSAPSLHRPEPEELAVPVNGSLYTEEFELPPQQADYRGAGPIMPAEASMYTEEFEPPRQTPAGRGAVRPAQASLYTEEFSLPEEMSQPPAVQQPVQYRPVRQAPAKAPRPQPPAKIPADQMDTTELLREILYGDDNK